jgi:UDP-N-acetylglucosamine acyltransferase
MAPENLADDVVVGAFSYVGPLVRIATGARVGNNVTIEGDVLIGGDTHISPFAVIGEANEDKSPAGRIVIGERNKVREHVVIRSGAAASNAATSVGNDCLLCTGSYVGPGAQIANRVMLGTYSQLGEGARLEARVWASAFTGADPGVTVGQYSFTSGYAGIDRDAPPYAILLGFPFRVRGANTTNLKRCGFPEKVIDGLKDAFRALYDGKHRDVHDDALAEWAARTDLDEHQRYLVDFLVRRRRQHENAPARKGG